MIEIMIGTPELSDTARTLALLALEKVRQNGTLGVRQGETLRRAFTKAAGAFRWDSLPESGVDRAAVAARDVTKLADSGAELLERDLAELLTRKKGEIVQIKKVTKSILALAADTSMSYPTEVEYSHTMRSALGGLVTKTVTLHLRDATEALNAAAAIEKRLEGLGKLRDQMLEDLKDRQRQIRAMRKGLSGFVKSSDGVLAELLAQ
jgi:hypothetical protein